MNYIDVPVHRLKVSEILVSDISRDKLRILRKVKSESRRHSDHAVTMSNQLVTCAIGRMNDQQPTAPPELFVDGANHGSIQRCYAICLIPTICCDQYLTSAVRVLVHAPSPLARGRGQGGRYRITHAAVISA